MHGVSDADPPNQTQENPVTTSFDTTPIGIAAIIAAIVAAPILILNMRRIRQGHTWSQITHRDITIAVILAAAAFALIGAADAVAVYAHARTFVMPWAWTAAAVFFAGAVLSDVAVLRRATAKISSR